MTKVICAPLSILAYLLVAACSAGENGSETCGGFILSAPEGERIGISSLSVAELMAHSAAMGMTQQEAETLLYLEGISPSDRLEPGESICVDGKPQ